MTLIDERFQSMCAGDRRAFAEWMGRVERPIRRSLEPFARAVDVEGVVQETLLRMWLFALDRGHELTGENGSLRFAIGMARNLARNQARRLVREVLLPADEMPEPAVLDDPPPDPGLRRVIEECLGRLKGKPLVALRERLDNGHLRDDRRVARAIGMTVNTLLQNIVRARRQLAECLEGKGVHVGELLR